jgi:hypothetical protein
MNFLPGWSPGFLTGKTALSSITQVLSATATTSTINFPGGIQAGDLIVFFDACFASGFAGTPASVTPTGFTLAQGNSGGGAASPFTAGRFNTWYKLATGSESGALTGMNDTTMYKAMYVFRGNAPATAITLGGAGGQLSDADPADVSVTASGGVAPLVVIGSYASTGTVSPRTFSTTKDGEINANVRAYLAYKIYNSSPANSTIGIDDEGATNCVQGCYLAMAN